ncbi:MAG: WYL domain-containing protein [Thiobacillaceae bacterium]
MSRLDKLYLLHRALHGRHVGIARDELMRKLEIGRSTLTRLVKQLRETFNAPLIHDPERGGYLYDVQSGRFDLPGLWFSADEILALLTLQNLLASLQPGPLDEQLAPFKTRLEKILDTQQLGNGEAQKRIRILSMAARSKQMHHFQTVASAVLQRKRLVIDYYNRDRDETSSREVSPQRLAHYRDNWYLDAWCHSKKGLRIFAVECIRRADSLNKSAKAVPEANLNKELASAYGIFAGTPTATAVLRFTAHRARWVADETWHPGQKSRWLPEGRYELSIPYANDKELIMDILKYGAEVEVVAPETLREAVKNHFHAAGKLYE